MINYNFSGNYGFDPVRNLGIEACDYSGLSFYIGVGAPESSETDPHYKVRLNLETPNFLYRDSHEHETHYDLSLHLCPYTCNYLNAKYGVTKFKPTFFPIRWYERPAVERGIPVFYTGSAIRSLSVYETIERELVHRLGPRYGELKCRIATPSVEGYIEKLNLLSETKIALIHNVLSGASTIPNFDSFAKDPLCIQHLPWHTKDSELLPQFKSRTFEAAMMGCVLLVYKDKYRTIERYFTEHEHFIYYENDLSEKIDHILSHYEEYRPMAERAKQKVKDCYTTEHFIEYIRALKDTA